MRHPRPFRKEDFPYPFSELLDHEFLANEGDTALSTLLQQCESMAAVLEAACSSPDFLGIDTGDFVEAFAPTMKLLHEHLCCTRKLFTAWTQRREATD